MFEREAEPFGWSLALDLYGCSRSLLEDAEHIRDFAIHLCDEVLLMRRYGDAQVEWFGEAHPKTAGYSLVQLIETSSVVGHFSGERLSAHLDIFSCRTFDSDAVERFSKTRFRAESAKSVFVVRK